MAAQEEGGKQGGPELEKLIRTISGMISQLRETNSGLATLLSALRRDQHDVIAEAKRRILASKLRSQIYELCDSKHSVQDISRELGKAGPLVTRYLREMERTGLVASVQEGKRKFYYKVI